jgi:hypothetical protein
MDERKDKAAWEKAIRLFRSKYPTQYWDNDNTAAYRSMLLFYPIGAVVAGLETAAKESPERMPHAGIVRDTVQRLEKERLRKNREPDEHDNWENPARNVDDVQAYIDAADTPYERFARQWEADSLGQVTREQKLQHIREVSAALEKDIKGMT